MNFLEKLFASDASPGSGEDPPYYAPLSAGDYTAALPLLSQAIREEDAHAMGVFAALTAMGRGTESNPEEAAAWFRQAAVRGDLMSQTAFGVCLAVGFGLEADLAEAAYWLYKAGQRGHKTAIHCLGDLALKDMSVIGKHFSEAEFRELMRQAPVRPSKAH